MPRQKFWQTARFKELQKIWEMKLRESGFIDQEQNGRLIQNSANSYRTKDQTTIENKRRYYELLGQKYHEEDFSDPVEKYVMSRRLDAVTVRQISLELKGMNKKSGRETIRKIICFYEKKWHLKKKKS